MKILKESLLRVIPSILVLVAGIFGFYYTTKITIANNSKAIQSNKNEIRIMKKQLHDHEVEDMTMGDFLQLKGDLIRELENTQTQLEKTNERLDKLIFTTTNNSNQ